MISEDIRITVIRPTPHSKTFVIQKKATCVIWEWIETRFSNNGYTECRTKTKGGHDENRRTRPETKPVNYKHPVGLVERVKYSDIQYVDSVKSTKKVRYLDSI